MMSHDGPRGHRATAVWERGQLGWGACPGVFAPGEAQGLLSSTSSFLEHWSHHRARVASSTHAQVGGLGSTGVWDSKGVLLQPRAGVCSLPQEEGLYFILGRGVMEGQTAAPSRALKDGVKGR